MSLREGDDGLTENVRDAIMDCIERVGYAFYLLQCASTIGEQSTAYTALANSVFDLTTWHPRFDSETGEIAEEGIEA